MIEPGMLIEYLRDDEAVPLVVRVLYVDIYGTNVAVIDVDNRSAEPVWNKVTDLDQSLATEAARVLQIDHARPPVILEEELPEEDKRFRDRAWDSIQPFFSGENQLSMLFPRERAGLIRHRAKEIGVSRKTLYKRARRYWQGGQTPNTQLSHYRNCGTNKNRKVTKKLGRPSLLSKAEGRSIGINIDSAWKESIIRAGRMFYENRDTTYKKAYKKALAHFHKVGYAIIHGVKTPILPQVETVFSIGQFKYHYKKDSIQRLRSVLISRHGDRGFNLRHREVLGSSTREAFGPGSLFQVDATMADVYLVSRSNRNQIVGRPVIHAIIDVFSRMVVGISVRPEPEAWLGMNLAIENATVDKVSFCEKHGIYINEDQWPVACLPERLLGDRGPLEGSNVENLIKTCNVSIENTPPYRADWKGIVEQYFNALNMKLIHHVDGAVYRNRERGERDYRLDAVFDIEEFTQLLLTCVIDHNTKNRMEWYDMNEFLIRDEVAPYPVDLFRWGKRNRQGLLRNRDPEQVRLALLPSDTATITERGIRFRKRFYFSEKAEQEAWYLRARNSGRWSMRAAYDPRTTKVIFLRPEDGTTSIECRLRDPDDAFRDADWSEVDCYFENKEVAAQRATTAGLQSDVEMMAYLTHKNAEANKKKAQVLVPGQSNLSRTRNIRQNRRDEASAIHREEAAHLYGLTDSIPFDENRRDAEEFKAIPFPQPTNIRELRQRRMNNGKKK